MTYISVIILIISFVEIIGGKKCAVSVTNIKSVVAVRIFYRFFGDGNKLAENLVCVINIKLAFTVKPV